MGRVLIGSKVVGSKDSSGKFTQKKGVKLSRSEQRIVSKVTGETQIKTTRDRSGRVSQTVEATPDAMRVLGAVSPSESEQIQVRKEKVSKGAGPVQSKVEMAKAKGSIRLQATPEAARVLKDIGHKDAEKVIVPTGRTLPGGGERFYTELSQKDYTTYEVTKALGKEEQFYAIARRPKPLYGEDKKVRIGAEPTTIKIDKKAFREEQAQIWQGKRPKEVSQYSVWDVIKEPDQFYKQVKEEHPTALKRYQAFESVSQIGGKLLTTFEATKLVGGVVRKTSQYAKTSRSPIVRAGGYILESVGRYAEEKPVGASMRLGGAVILGAGTGLIEGAMAKSTVKGLGAAATKYVWRGGMLIATGLYGKERFESIKGAETYEARQIEVAKTGVDVLGFGVGARVGYGKGVGKGKSTPKEKPIPKVKSTSKKPSKKTFKPHDYFIRRATKEGKTTFYRVSRETGISSKITRVEVHKYKDIFGLGGKKGQARMPDFRLKGRSSERGLKRTKGELIKQESGLSIVRRTEVSTPKYSLVKTRPRSIRVRKSPKEIVPTQPKNIIPTQPKDIYKPGTDIIKQPKYPIEPRREHPLRERPKSELTTIRENLIRERPRPPRPTPRKGGGGIPIPLGWGGVNIGAGGGLMGIFRRSKTPKGKKGRYTPSQSAIEFKIYGDAPTGTLTGLEERPLTGQPKKRKSLFDKYSRL